MAATSSSGKRAAMYARFSSDLQNDRSITGQFQMCDEFAKRDGLKVIATFEDRAKSGATIHDRDGLASCVAAAKAKKFDVLIVDSLDRLSRSLSELPALLENFNFHGVKILTVHEGEATRMLAALRGLIGAQQLEDLARHVRRGQGVRVREGKLPGAIAYGYRRVSGKPGDREIDPEQAKIIRRIFTDYAGGVSSAAIAKSLTRDGVPPPRNARAWSAQCFVGGQLRAGMLGNPIYVGRIEWNRTRRFRNPETGKKLQRRTGPGEIIATDAPHLRIIDQNLWEAANAVRKARGARSLGAKRFPNSTNRNHLLSGVLKCGACGGHMRIAQRTRDGGPRAACAAADSTASCEHTKSYNMNWLLAGVADFMKTRLTDPKAVARAAHDYHVEWTKQQRANRFNAAEARKKLNRVQSQIDRLVMAITDTSAPIPELRDRLKQLHQERMKISEDLRGAEAGENVVALHPNVIEQYAANVERLHLALGADELTTEARAAFGQLVDSIVVHPPGPSRRAPYDFEVWGRLSAMVGGELFPSTPAKGRKHKGNLNYDSDNARNSALPESDSRVAPFGRHKYRVGRYKGAAA